MAFVEKDKRIGAVRCLFLCLWEDGSAKLKRDISAWKRILASRWCQVLQLARSLLPDIHVSPNQQFAIRHIA